MALWILRFVFLAVSIGVGDHMMSAPDFNRAPWLVLPTVILGAVTFIVIDALTPRKRIEIVSSVYIGIVVGLFLTYLLGLAITPWLSSLTEGGRGSTTVTNIQLMVSIAICYVCISVLIQTKDDFRFIIPYVEFSKEVKGVRPLILDTSVVIDGRIADVVDTGVFDTQLIMPRFVLAELQAIADSTDKMRRARRPPGTGRA